MPLGSNARLIPAKSRLFGEFSPHTPTWRRTESGACSTGGFSIRTVANHPLNKLIVGTAEIRYGTKGAAQARVVAAQVASPVLMLDKRTSVTVDFVIGEAYTTLNTPAQAAVQLTASASSTATPHC